MKKKKKHLLQNETFSKTWQPFLLTSHCNLFRVVLSFEPAYPLHRNSREATGTNSQANQAHEKTEQTKDVDKMYKSHIDTSGLYDQDYHSRNPITEEMQHKLNMESERLRARLRQELAELQERLSPSPAHLSSTLASMRERLAPLTRQLQSSLSSNTQDLCGQLSIYLQGLERAEAQPEHSPAIYQEAFHWMSQSLEHSSSKLAESISNFHTKTAGVVQHLRENSAHEEEAAELALWQEISSRLGQEVNSLRVQAHSKMGVLKVKLTALLETAHPQTAELTASMEQFCQNAALQNQMFQARLNTLIQGELQVQGASSSSRSPSSSSVQPSGSLQGDFIVQLSALIQDIMHSV
uniref:Uncharacterized protein n=1 Tax=Mola mola TaxID=94237 RepID=A0A3Q3WLN4_MOLML